MPAPGRVDGPFPAVAIDEEFILIVSNKGLEDVQPYQIFFD